MLLMFAGQRVAHLARRAAWFQIGSTQDCVEMGVERMLRLHIVTCLGSTCFAEGRLLGCYGAMPKHSTASGGSGAGFW